MAFIPLGVWRRDFHSSGVLHVASTQLLQSTNRSTQEMAAAFLMSMSLDDFLRKRMTNLRVYQAMLDFLRREVGASAPASSSLLLEATLSTLANVSLERCVFVCFPALFANLNRT